jgi:hypothetical protein
MENEYHTQSQMARENHLRIGSAVRSPNNAAKFQELSGNRLVLSFPSSSLGTRLICEAPASIGKAHTQVRSALSPCSKQSFADNLRSQAGAWERENNDLTFRALQTGD